MSTPDPLTETVALTLHYGACDGTHEDCPFWAHHLERARAVYEAIAATGRLAEPGAILPLAVPPVPDNPGETWQEWGYRVTLPDGATVDHFEEDEGCWDENDAAKMMAEALTDYEDGCAAVLIRRTAWYSTTAWEVAQ